MSAADRQREFDDLLARHVRRTLPEETGGACPDANLLAAYQEHSLTPEDAAACREHFAGCARCREILAALEVSEGIPVEEPARQATPTPVRGEERQTGRRLRWLVPAGALAMAMLLWIAVLERKHEEKMAMAPKEAPVQMAENRPQAPPAPAPGLLPPAPLERRVENAPPAEKRNGNAAERTRSRINDSGIRGYAGGEAYSGPSVAQERTTIGGKKKAAEEGEAVALGQFTGNNKIADIAPSRHKNEAVAKPEAAPAAEALGAVSSLPAPAAAAPAAKTEAKAALAAEGAAVLKEQAADKIAAQQQTGKITANFDSSALSAGALRKQTPMAIAKAPGGEVLWRAGAMGRIERSMDGGQTWQPQPSGVTADLLAASAPSERVCWVAGREGTILLTTDGSTWRKIPGPETLDFIGITASDEHRAIVWGRAEGQRYSTEDGGQHWTRTTQK